jgi:hypothetical protein
MDIAEARKFASSGKKNGGKSGKRTDHGTGSNGKMGKRRRMSQEQAAREFGERRKNPAYRNGWEDGRFGPMRLFLENSNLAEWADHRERLSYYRGHREGRRVREMMAHGGSA